jgi:hypothetical protein
MVDDAQKHILIYKLSVILGETQDRIKWDMSLQDQIVQLVKKYEELADIAEVNVYER